MRCSTLIAIVLLAVVTYGQQARPFAQLDTTKIRIGEHVTLDLSISYRVDEGESKILFPSLKDTITGKVEVVKAGMVDTSLIDPENDPYAFRRSQRIVITSFEEGFWAIPPFQFNVNGDTLETTPLLLEVQTVDVDTTLAIKDIKEIYEVPFTFMDWLKNNWQWVAGGVGVAGLLALVLFLVFRKRPMEEEGSNEPSIPYYIRYRTALDELEEKKLWQSGLVKQYYIELTEILREYLEKRYSINALEFTTAQLIGALSFTEMPADKRTQLQNLLELADMVKFAKALPIGEENEMALRTSRELIDSTRDRSEDLKRSNEVE